VCGGGAARGRGRGGTPREADPGPGPSPHPPQSNPSLDPDATVRAALGALGAVLGEDLKAGDVEVGVVRAGDGGKFRTLTQAEIDDHLVALSERD